MVNRPSFLFLKTCRSILCWKTGKAPSGWATEQGLGRYNRNLKLKEFTNHLGKTSLTRVNSVCFDREGSVWLGTGKSGLVRISESSFDNYTTNEGLSSERINIVAEGNQKFTSALMMQR